MHSSSSSMPWLSMRHGRHDRRLPGPGLALAQRDHAAELPDQGLGAVPVALVHHEDVADLQDARPWPPAPRRPSPGPAAPASCPPVAATSISDWPTPDRLQQHRVEAGRIEHPQRLGRGRGQPAEVTAGGHRPDVDPVVQRVTSASAPGRPAGHRRRTVSSGSTASTPTRCPVCPQRRDQRRGGGGLAHPGRAGQADDVGPAGVAGQGAGQPRAGRPSRSRSG